MSSKKFKRSKRFLPFSRLKAYAKAKEFHRMVVRLKKHIPRGLGDLYDQLHRASTSACLNIAEGASCWAIANKRRYYRVALSSQGESGAVLELLDNEGVATPDILNTMTECLLDAANLTGGLVRRQ